VLVLSMCAALGRGAVHTETAGLPPAANVLLELFTSEGCESCPPADELLIELVRTQPLPGVRIVALSEHVDYWDRLGWVDPFSSALFTKRQEAYGKALRTETYTPQAVIDGRAAMIGSSRAEVLAAIRKAAAAPKATVELTFTPDLQITIPPNLLAADGDVFLVVTGDRLTSNVRRGENQGRALNHDAVTRRVTPVGTTSREGSFAKTVPIEKMLDAAWKRSELRVVVFVQAKGAVVGVNGGQVPSSAFQVPGSRFRIANPRTRTRNPEPGTPNAEPEPGTRNPPTESSPIPLAVAIISRRFSSSAASLLGTVRRLVR
jgi:hypothetical protein